MSRVEERGTWRGSGQPGAPVGRNPGAAERIPSDPDEGLRSRIVGLTWIVAWEAVRRMPESLAFGLGDVAGRLWYWVAPKGRRKLRANLARVVGADALLEPTVKRAHRSYARYWVEAFRAADLTPEQLETRTSTTDYGHLDDALDAGRGVIVLLAHHGSWDVAAAWAESQGYHLAVVAEVVRPRALFHKFVRLREAIGLEVVPLRTRHSEGDRAIRLPRVTARLEEVLAENHLVGLLSDRDLTRRASMTSLFGHPWRVPSGAVTLSRRTGALVVPVTMRQEPGRRWHVQAWPPMDVASMPIGEARAAIAGALEQVIRSDVAQWHAFSRVWEEPDPPSAQREQGEG